MALVRSVFLLSVLYVLAESYNKLFCIGRKLQLLIVADLAADIVKVSVFDVCRIS